MSPHAPAHARPVAVVAEELGVDPATGLSEVEAAARLAANGPNVLATDAQPTWFERLARQFADPLVLLLIAAVAISLIAWCFEDESGWPVDALVISTIVIANALLGATQEHRADQAVQALAKMTAGQARVMRDAVPRQIAISDVVVGDVLIVRQGDIIAADARLAGSESLQVAEAALTGESMPVLKNEATVDADAAVGDRLNMLHGGTAAVSGSARGVVTATGMQTEVGRIADMLSTTDQLPTPLEREIARVSRQLGIAVIVISIVIAIVIALHSTIDSTGDAVEILIIAVSVAVAAVPEGLPAVLSVVLAIGVSRMARRQALVKRLASAETLGATSVICTDKTGTLTRNEMQVEIVIVPAGSSTMRSLPDSGPLRDEIADVLVAAALASNVRLDHDGDAPTLVGDPTEIALVEAAERVRRPAGAIGDTPRLGEIPFNADRKRMSVLIQGRSYAADRRLITKGAPDLLLDRCSSERLGDGTRPLTNVDRERWHRETAALADRGMRTLLIASKPIDAHVVLDDSVENDLTLLGVLGIMDPPRAEAAGAIANAQAAGIRVLMLTGDHPNTGASIATTLGIAPPEAKAVTGAQLDAVDDEGLGELLAHNTVFARVAPAHKLRMVRSLQREGHVVAMTGDGVNDAPALKAADIGTAMGRSGTDVAREAADMVLTDDNFATIIEAVRAGRTIFHNVKSFLRYLLSSNVGEVLTIFLGVLMAGVIGLRADGADIIAPLTAAQILWINLLTDTGPAFALGLDPPDAHVMARRPRGPHDRVINVRMQRGIAVVGIVMAVTTLLTFDAKRPGGLIEGSSDLETARTAAFTVLVLAQLFNCFSARSDTQSAFPRWAQNRLLLAAVAVSLALQFAVVYVPVLQRGFGTAPLSATDWLMATAVASSVLWASEVRKWLERAADRRAGGTDMPLRV